VKVFRRKMALEKAGGSLEKVARGIHEREKEGINKVSARLYRRLKNQSSYLLTSDTEKYQF